eukprot:181388-Chlamydomonas_euryale.AAC.1
MPAAVPYRTSTRSGQSGYGPYRAPPFPDRFPWRMHIYLHSFSFIWLLLRLFSKLQLCAAYSLLMQTHTANTHTARSTHTHTLTAHTAYTHTEVHSTQAHRHACKRPLHSHVYCKIPVSGVRKNMECATILCIIRSIAESTMRH